MKYDYYVFAGPVQMVISELQNHYDRLTPWEQEFIFDVERFGQEEMYLTYKQMRILGQMSKKYLQGGRYMTHNWWNDIKNIRKWNKEQFDPRTATNEARIRFLEILEAKQNEYF